MEPGQRMVVPENKSLWIHKPNWAANNHRSQVLP